MSTPLSPDFLIVEMGERLAAAACGSLLAELGATVVVVERTGQAPAHGKARHRATMAAGKRSVLLDADDASSVALVTELIGGADAVVVSSDLDGEWPAAVSAALNARDDLCDVTAFRDGKGPALSDAMMQAFTGTMDTTGDPDSKPTLTRAPVMEVPTGIYAAAGVLLAQAGRRRYGLSQAMRISLFDCAISMMTTFLPRYLMGGEPQRIGNHHASMSPWNAYPAKDGWVMVCSGSNDQWKRIAALLGRPELGTDPNFATATARVRANPDIDRMMADWMANYSVDECLERLNGATIPCGPVSEISQLFADKSLLHRKMINRVHDQAANREVHVPGTLFRGSRSRGASAQQLPRPGADNASIAAMMQERRAAQITPAMAAKPVLDGIKVIEIGQYTTAPLTARQLGAFGADVIKVEPPDGEPARTLPPHRDGQSVFFTLSNSDKRSVAIDLKNPDDKRRLADMVRKADVLVENMKPGALKRFGFSPQELAELNPRLVYCAVSGFGMDSPNAALGAMDTTIQGMSGLMDLTRCDGTPFKIGISIADIIGGQLGFTFILAALEERARSGKGQFIDLSMQDAAAWIVRTEWNGVSETLPVLLPCQDGFVVCEGGDGALGAKTAQQTREAAARSLAATGHTATPVMKLSEVLKSPHVAERDVILTGKSPIGAEWHLLNSPIRLAKTPAQVTRAMGPLGYDCENTLRDWGLGVSEAAE
jgi:crotonobetainyl-CoA:carnitine CoA-transferase CaiB-like acyl-CoA transferase